MMKYLLIALIFTLSNIAFADNYKVKLHSVSLTRTRSFELENVSISALKIKFEFVWAEGHKPIGTEKIIIESLDSDNGTSLIKEDNNNVGFNSTTSSIRTIYEYEAKAPKKETKKLVNIKGHLPIIENLIFDTIVIKELAVDAVLDSKNPFLRKHKFKILDIGVNSIDIKFNGSITDIESMQIRKKNGGIINKAGHFAMGNKYTVNFQNSFKNNCSLIIIYKKDKKIKKIPFYFKEIELP